MRKRLYRALAVYAALAVAAAFTLDADLRIGVLVLLAALAVKCWLDVKKSELS
jgi:diacylglycerol kinase